MPDQLSSHSHSAAFQRSKSNTLGMLHILQAPTSEDKAPTIILPTEQEIIRLAKAVQFLLPRWSPLIDVPSREKQESQDIFNLFINDCKKRQDLPQFSRVFNAQLIKNVNELNDASCQAKKTIAELNEKVRFVKVLSTCWERKSVVHFWLYLTGRLPEQEQISKLNVLIQTNRPLTEALLYISKEVKKIAARPPESGCALLGPHGELLPLDLGPGGMPGGFFNPKRRTNNQPAAAEAASQHLNTFKSG